ncbi:hypothetical protein [Couchioplanes azureus]|uniref:hypothetical protein n=1 Tax=Couchioplanes caeruleus TaxID=56438 RepID=UPI001671781C|nr:hypothetical protein [Couchioplanes caeruleus]GGQ60219.1 hypothetical protein GCM10010166_32290 [Couchioplanes caeruleus subsp. azureus]
MIRPFVQGDPSRPARRARGFLAVLAAAHIAMAGFVAALLHQVGTVPAAHIDDGVAVAACLVAAVAGAAFDVHALTSGAYAPGLRRQTSKELGQRAGLPWWVAPLIWGLDTGLMWSTFRVSSTTWVLLAAVALHVAPPWSGLVAGTAFAVPLAVAVLAGRGDLSELGRPGPRRLAQLAAVVTALSPTALITATILT